MPQRIGLKTKSLADRSCDWIRASQAKITCNVMNSGSRQLLQAAAGAFLSANKKRPDFVSLRGRSAAVAIFKPKVWHPAAKHGSRKRQNPEFLIRRGATPHRCFSGSAISRGRQPAFHMLQHLSHDQRSYFTAQPCRASFRDVVLFRLRLPRRAHAPSSQ